MRFRKQIALRCWNDRGITRDTNQAVARSNRAGCSRNIKDLRKCVGPFLWWVLFQRGMREVAILVPWCFHFLGGRCVTPFTVFKCEISRNAEAIMVYSVLVSSASQMTNLTVNIVHTVSAFFPLLDNMRGLCRMAIDARVGLGGSFDIESAPYYDHCRGTNCRKK